MFSPGSTRRLDDRVMPEGGVLRRPFRNRMTFVGLLVLGSFGGALLLRLLFPRALPTSATYLWLYGGLAVVGLVLFVAGRRRPPSGPGFSPR